MWKRIHLVEAMCLLQRPSIHEIVVLVGWDTGNSCLQSQWYHFSSPIFEYGIPQCPQRPIVLHAIYGQKNLGEARGAWVRRYSMVGGSEEASGASLLPAYGAHVGIWFLQSLTFLESGTPSAKSLTANLRRAQPTARRTVVWGAWGGRIWLVGRAFPPPPNSGLHCLCVTTWALPNHSWTSEASTQDQTGLFKINASPFLGKITVTWE